MKRHAQLQDLSREHHIALTLALEAKRAALSGAPAELESAASACLAAFPRALDAHFVVEEKTLLPLLSAAGESELVARVWREHEELRQLIAQMEKVEAKTLLRFAELLAAHVRFEERDLFAILEGLLGGTGKSAH